MRAPVKVVGWGVMKQILKDKKNGEKLQKCKICSNKKNLSGNRTE